MGGIRVLVVDDHAGLRAELRRLIESLPDLRVVAAAGSAQEGVRLTGKQALTVAVMDRSLPDGHAQRPAERRAAGSVARALCA